MRRLKGQKKGAVRNSPTFDNNGGTKDLGSAVIAQLFQSVRVEAYVGQYTTPYLGTKVPVN